MAHNSEEVSIEDNNMLTRHIVKAQALFRGVLVRKWIKSTREEFCAICSDLENDSQIFIHWPWSTPCRPRAVKEKQFKCNTGKFKHTSNKTQENSITYVSPKGKFSVCECTFDLHQDHNQTELKNENYPVAIKSELPIKASDEQDVLLPTEKLQTAETQTSFCDMLPCDSNNQKILTIVPEDITQSKKQESTNYVNLTSIHKKQRSQDEISMEVSKLDCDIMCDISGSGSSTTAQIQHSSLTDGKDAERQQTRDQKSAFTRKEQDMNTKDYSSTTKHLQRVDPNLVHHHSEVLTVTKATPTWDSFNSYQAESDMEARESATTGPVYPADAAGLTSLRNNIAMELLWVQQAIDSRKNYLKLKYQMEAS